MEIVQPIRDKKKIEAMKKILKATNLRDHALFVLGINSGLRISDLLKLEVQDVMNENGKLRDKIILREMKTNKAKEFPISDSARKALNDYLKDRKYEMNEPLFISRKKDKNGDRYLKRVQAYKLINAAAEQVGIATNEYKIGTHTLRKTFGYHAFKNGAGIEVIQKLLNHSSPSITLRYIGIEQEELDEVYLNLNL